MQVQMEEEGQMWDGWVVVCGRAEGTGRTKSLKQPPAHDIRDETRMYRQRSGGTSQASRSMLKNAQRTGHVRQQAARTTQQAASLKPEA